MEKIQTIRDFVMLLMLPPKGETVLIIPFIDEIMVGTFVFHCHIVGHEDMGMMAMITVNKPSITPPIDS